MDETAIRIELLDKSYAGQQVLKKASLMVNAGESIGLVGVNGAGKTTLIKCLLDFCEVDAGNIRIFDISHTNVSARQRLVFLPEKFIPPHYLTGKDFLIYMSKLHDMEFDYNRVKSLLKITDLDASALDKPVRQYSKGMGQKLGIISCLLSDRELIIFDEPMSGLDPKARAYLKKYLIELKQDGKTLFFSTHLLNDVESICDGLAILHYGTIQFAGTIPACCEHYETGDLEQAYLKCVGG